RPGRPGGRARRGAAAGRRRREVHPDRPALPARAPLASPRTLRPDAAEPGALPAGPARPAARGRGAPVLGVLLVVPPGAGACDRGFYPLAISSRTTAWRTP